MAHGCVHRPDSNAFDLCSKCRLYICDESVEREFLIAGWEAHNIVDRYGECSGCFYCHWDGEFCECEDQS